MSEGYKKHDEVIKTTLTELVLLLHFGFVMAFGALAIKYKDMGEKLDKAQLEPEVNPRKDPETGEPKPPTVEIPVCGRGTILDGNTCVPDTTHKENHCYLLNGRDQAIFNIVELGPLRGTIRYTTRPEAFLTTEELANRKNAPFIQEISDAYSKSAKIQKGIAISAQVQLDWKAIETRALWLEGLGKARPKPCLFAYSHYEMTVSNALGFLALNGPLRPIPSTLPRK